MKEKDIVDIDQESSIKYKDKTMFNSVQTGKSKDVLVNTDIPSRPVISKSIMLYLAYQSVGVIYGDIGTSPLYVYSSTFTSTPTREDILGSLSIIIWTLTLVVTVKYCVFVLSASDNGEGGTFALYSLLARYARISWSNPNSVSRHGFSRHPTGDIRSINRSFRNWLENSNLLRHLVSLLAIIGVCMVLADGVLTPAQTVIGAIQGLKVAAPQITDAMRTGISEVILILIFAIQPIGTTKIAVTFAPIVVIWLLLNLACGVYNLVYYDASVFQAFSPYWIYHWFAHHGRQGWEMMGGTLLAITGVEALFADLGHFHASSVRLSWLGFAYPCLLIAYLGQAAYMVQDTTGTAWSNAFFASVPPAAFWFAFVMALLAAIVASQAMISACFSILSQAINLSNIPQLKIVHTSHKFQGQVYIPVANWLLMIATVAVAGGFQNTVALGNAYGTCVVMSTFVTTIFTTLVSIIVWRWNILLSLAFFCFFGLIDGAYLSSSLLKVPNGAWFTIAMGLVLSLLMGIWRYGTIKQWAYETLLRKQDVRGEEIDMSGDSMVILRPTTSNLSPWDGIFIVFDPAGFDVPTAYRHLRSVLQVEPSVVIFCHSRSVNIATVPTEERSIVFLDDSFASTNNTNSSAYRIILRQGYKDLPPSESELDEYVVNRIEELLRADEMFERADKLQKAKEQRIVYLTNTVNVTSKPGTFIIKRVIIECYAWLLRNSMENRQTLYGVPVDKMIQIGMLYEL